MVDNESSTVASALQSFLTTHMDRGFSSWITSVLANVLSYSIVVIPVVLLVTFGHRYLIQLKLRSPFTYRILSWLIGDSQSPSQSRSPSKHSSGHGHDSPSVDWTWPSIFRLAICITGLQLSFLSWGILQERMVTLSYGPQSRKFRDSLFLVFGNRSLAFIIAVVVVWFRKGYLLPRQSQQGSVSPISNIQPEIPFYCYLYAALSNIMGTWFQYEALKFVSFPLQVLSKTCKIIAVMLLGRCVQGKTYTLSQYLLAVTVTLGVTLFLFGNESVQPRSSKHNSDDASVVAVQLSDGTQLAVSLSGIALLSCYLLFDAFTSNWEERLFRQYPSISSYDMMAGINCWGTLLTTTALLVQGGFGEAWQFMSESKEFALHVVLLAISSAVGSLFIYYTISMFGALVFVSIMTVRQALAIFLSCIIYGHEITPVGLLGLLVVFISLGFQIALKRRSHTSPSGTTNARSQVVLPLLDDSKAPANFSFSKNAKSGENEI